MTQKAFIAGGTGFVGVNAANELARKGFAVTVMGQSEKRPSGLGKDITLLSGDSRLPGEWQKAVAASSLVINLAGASIFSRWSAEHKKLIRDSRILTTRNIARALVEADHSATFFSTSAVGYYGFHEDVELNESSGPGTDFLATLCRDWEAEAGKAAGASCRVVITRFGIVRGKNGGALGQMLPPFRYGLGGLVGSGHITGGQIIGVGSTVFCVGCFFVTAASIEGDGQQKGGQQVLHGKSRTFDGICSKTSTVDL